MKGWTRQRRRNRALCEDCGSKWVDLRFEGDMVIEARCPHCGGTG